MRILYVCTADVCRSPVAERLTTAWAEHALGPSAALVRVRSRGLDVEEGREIDRSSAAALVELGGNPAACYARQVVPDEAVGSDLVLTMTRRHRHELLKVAPRALRKTFTLREAADLVDRADTSGLEEIPLDSRALELALRLNAARSRRTATDTDDVVDPLGQPARVHTEVAREIAAALHPLLSLLLVPTPTATPARV